MNARINIYQYQPCRAHLAPARAGFQGNASDNGGDHCNDADNEDESQTKFLKEGDAQIPEDTNWNRHDYTGWELAKSGQRGGINDGLKRSVNKSEPRANHRLMFFARVSLGVLHRPAVNQACIEEQLVKLLIQAPMKVRMESMKTPHQTRL